MKRLAISVAILLAGAASSLATSPVPRTSPDFVISEASGQETRLSYYKGKVVVVEFLLIRCPHCWRVAQTIEKLQKELGPGSFQAIGIAFDNRVDAGVVSRFVNYFHLAYPVGYATSTDVDKFLGRSLIERVMVPQIVVIDPEGVIRAQSRPVGEKDLYTEAYLRQVVLQLQHAGRGSSDTGKGRNDSRR